MPVPLNPIATVHDNFDVESVVFITLNRFLEIYKWLACERAISALPVAEQY